MDKSIFNFHDLILLITAFECLGIVLFLLKSSRIKTLPTLLLAAFFAARFMISCHELVLWGSTFRNWVLELSPNLFFMIDFSYCLDGPLLYFYCRSITQPNFRMGYHHAVHLIPALLLVGFITATFYTLPVEHKEMLIRNYSFADLDFVLVDFLVKLSRLIYVGLAIRLITQWITKAGGATPTGQPWLKNLLIAFFAILSTEAMLSGIKLYHELFIFRYYDVVVENIGLSDYYLLFALINVVIFLAISPDPISERSKGKPVAKEPVNMKHVQKLESAMKVQKLYLNHHLSIERLAEKLDIPLKELSSTINRHYNVNFYEFINNFRIEEARQMLCDPKHSDKSITDIFFDAGFNSKSVYNTLFKKKYHQTPSLFRRQQEQQTKLAEST